MTKPSDTLARLRARSTEAGRFVLPLDPVWADKVTDAYGALRRAEMVEDDERATRVAEARAVIAELTESMDDNVMIWRFRRLSRPQYDDLVSRTPPSDKQKEAQAELPAAQRAVFDLEAMRWSLLSEVCIDPRYTLEEAQELLEGADEDGNPYLSRGESEALVNSAMSSALSTPRQLPRELTLP
jgi:hypothetical protein